MRSLPDEVVTKMNCALLTKYDKELFTTCTIDMQIT